MRIYLTGFMASGKSTVGPKVAARLGCTFLDLDRLIAVHEGRSIPTIFAEDGEERFRELETQALHQTVEQDNLVVALGGGALVDDENRAFTKENGRVVYLEVDAETVVARVGDEADQRPLLQAEDGTPLSGAAMHSRVEGMLAEREATYADAHVTVDATGEIAEVVDAVTAAVREPDRA
jgi:shikimate kinase